MRIADHAELRPHARAQRREGMDGGHDRLAQFRVVDVLIIDERRRNRAIVIRRRRLESRQANLQGGHVDRHKSIAAGLDRRRILHLGIVRILDNALGKPGHLPGDTHRRLRRRLQTRRTDFERNPLRAEKRIGILLLLRRRHHARRGKRAACRQKLTSVHPTISPSKSNPFAFVSRT